VTEHRVLRDEASGTLTRRASLFSMPAGSFSCVGGEKSAAGSGSGDGGGGGEGRGGATDRSSGEVHRLHEGPRSYSAVVLEGPGLYRLGIIDLLQEWNLKKRGERFLKIFLKGRCSRRARNGMSAIEPSKYAFRFVDQIGVKLLGMKPEDVREVWAQCERSILERMQTERSWTQSRRGLHERSTGTPCGSSASVGAAQVHVTHSIEAEMTDTPRSGGRGGSGSGRASHE